MKKFSMAIGFLSVCTGNALAYQPPQNERVIAAQLINDDLQSALSGGASAIGQRIGFNKATPRSIALDYLENEVAANERYQGQVTAIQGQVLSIQAGHGEPFIEFAHSGEWGLRAYFDRSESADLAKLRKLDAAEVVCKGDGVALGVPIFRGCVMAAKWRKATATQTLRSLDEFYAGRDTASLNRSLAATTTAIAGMLPPGSDCLSHSEVCYEQMLAFNRLRDEDKLNRLGAAAEMLKKSGLTSLEGAK